MSEIYRPLRTERGVDLGLGYLEEGLSCYEIDFDPPYQRGHVWTEAQQRAFVGHFISGGPVPPYLVNRAGDGLGGERFELVDGKQRLTAIRRWTAGEIQAELLDGRSIFIDDTDRRFLMGPSVRLTFVRLSPREVLEFYLLFNGAGTPHSPEELGRVRAMLERSERENDR